MDVQFFVFAFKNGIYVTLKKKEILSNKHYWVLKKGLLREPINISYLKIKLIWFSICWEFPLPYEKSLKSKTERNVVFIVEKWSGRYEVDGNKVFLLLIKVRQHFQQQLLNVVVNSEHCIKQYINQCKTITM